MNNPTQESATSDNATPIAWQATDSIVQSHTATWYCFATLILIAVYAALATAKFFNQVNWLGAISMALLATLVYISLVILSKNSNHQVNYALSDSGIKIETMTRNFSNYRAFGIEHKGNLWRIVLVPNKRFAISDIIYIPEDKGEVIVDFLGKHLPIEDIKPDPTERIFRALHF